MKPAKTTLTHDMLFQEMHKNPSVPAELEVILPQKFSSPELWSKFSLGDKGF